MQWLKFASRGFKSKMLLGTVAAQILSLFDLFGVILAATSISVLISELQGSAIPESSTRLINSLGMNNLAFKEQFLTLSLLSLVFLLAKSIASAFVLFMNFKLLAGETVHLEDLLTRYVLMKRKYTSNRKDNVHRLIYGITNGVENLIVVRFGSQITLLMEIATVLILGMYFIFKEPQLALVFFLATWAVFGVLEKVINEKSRKLGQLLYHGLTTVSQKLHEGLMMQREFLVWRMDNPKIQEALPLRNQLAHTKAKATMLPNISKHIIEISFAFLVVSLSFLSIRVDNAKSGIESIILLFLVSSRMIPALLRAQNALLSIKNVQGSSEITISLLDEMSKVDEESEDNEYFSKNPSVENITFVYDDSKKATINNVSFKLEKGDVVGVIGKTGSGKSTLINILVGLLEPQSGRVYRFKSSGNLLAKHRIGVSYIPQDSFIFGGTVRENVLCGRKFKDEDVLLALNVAQFGIANIGDGELLEYRLELGGGNLSGGEKQRIAIARGIIGRPGFLVLDEATSALDVHTESKVYSSLLDFLSKDSIIVIITHRIESLKHANRFFDISNGKVLDHRDLSEIAIKMREPRRKIAKRRA